MKRAPGTCQKACQLRCLNNRNLHPKYKPHVRLLRNLNYVERGVSLQAECKHMGEGLILIAAVRKRGRIPTEAYREGAPGTFGEAQ